MYTGDEMRRSLEEEEEMNIRDDHVMLLWALQKISSVKVYQEVASQWVALKTVARNNMQGKTSRAIFSLYELLLQ
jgi:hypothetical protein